MDSHSDSKTFAEELQWCIGQLELGLQRQSPNSKQALESIKVLKILKSQKAPMVKKRQVMRYTFGDYRKKMKDAEKKSLSGLHHSRFQPLGMANVLKASRFLKMSYHKRQNIDHIQGDIGKNLEELHLQSLVGEPTTSLSQNATVSSTNLATHQQGYNFDDSKSEENQRNNSIAYLDQGNLHNGDTRFLNQQIKDTTLASQVKPVTANCFGYPSLNENNSCSTHASNSFNNTSSTATEEAATSSKSCSLTKQGNSFKYEPSDNMFVFNFENAEISDEECFNKDEFKKESEARSFSEKPAVSVYKYEKSENDFCFNFQGDN